MERHLQAFRENLLWYSRLSGKFWRLKRFTMCPLPAWEGSDAARNYYFLCKIHTMWLQFKKLIFSSQSQVRLYDLYHNQPFQVQNPSPLQWNRYSAAVLGAASYLRC